MPLFLSLAALVLLLHHLWLHHRQPSPYMDELFHVPQAVTFCSSFLSFSLPSYNPSITTLPGLYLPAALLHALTLGIFPCSVRTLRLSSAVASLLTLLALVPVLRLLGKRTGHASDGNDIYAALALWLHPVMFFYALLFYTDAPASLYIILAWRDALHGRHIRSALAGLTATLTRQTNMAWHAYIAADHAVEVVLRQRRRTRQKGDAVLIVVRGMCCELWPHALAGGVYAAFLVVNGGPAVGDKAHHAPTAHWAMLPYFLGFHALSYLPFQLASPGELLGQLRLLSWSRPLQMGVTALCTALGAMIIATGDSVHPFVLADNRHYTFYVYRRWLLRAAWKRLALVPVYAWGAIGPVLELAQRRREAAEEREMGASKREGESLPAGMDSYVAAEGVRDVLLLLCAAATLVSSPLLEPRYFFVASTFLSVRRLARRKKEIPSGRLLLIAMMCAAVNVALVCVFAELPFERPIDPHMPNDLSPGRFMF